MPDGAAPQTTKRKRDTGAKVRIGWAVPEEIAATEGLTKLGFELMSRREQLRLEREGVPESEMPTARQLNDYWQEHASPPKDRDPKPAVRGTPSVAPTAIIRGTSMKNSRKTTTQADEEAMILDSFLRFAERGEDELARYLLHCGIDNHDIDAAGDIPSAILAHYRRPSGRYDIDAMVHDWFRWPPVVARIEELKRERASR